MKSPKKHYDLEFKQRIVSEFIEGRLSAVEIAKREGIDPANVYSWKSKLETQAKQRRIEVLVEGGSTVEDARRILELEEELSDAKQLIAAYAMANEFLKKVQTPREKKSSGYIETKRAWARSKWRAK